MYKGILWAIVHRATKSQIQLKQLSMYTSKKKKVETIIQKDTGTPMFIAALFTVAKTWKLPKCPSR